MTTPSFFIERFSRIVFTWVSVWGIGSAFLDGQKGFHLDRDIG